MDHVTHLGLDVHKDTIAVAIFRPGQSVPDERVIPNTPEALRKLVARRRSSVDHGHVVVDLALPTDFVIFRLLKSRFARRVLDPLLGRRAQVEAGLRRDH